MKTYQYDILVVGGGAFGLSAALELHKRKYKVGLINPDQIPHHLAASTDISKVVRMEYGADEMYFEMAEKSIRIWREWNEFFGEEMYKEVGFLMLCKEKLDRGTQRFEQSSFELLLKKGYPAEHLRTPDIQARFPLIDPLTYPEAVFNPQGGYALSSRVIERMADYGKRLGVQIHPGQKAKTFDSEGGKLKSVLCQSGDIFKADQFLLAAGSHTPFLLPELEAYFRITGHPVFWLKPKDAQVFKAPHLPVFTADISNSGWYGFPFIEHPGVIKVAQHSDGLPIHPEQDDRYVKGKEIEGMRDFLKGFCSKLAKAPLVYTRRCLYTDTLDGHFWIDHHPEKTGLMVCSGGSGHGFKMTPLLGEIIADVLEKKPNPYAQRFVWRHLDQETVQAEEARFISQDPT